MKNKIITVGLIILIVVLLTIFIVVMPKEKEIQENVNNYESEIVDISKNNIKPRVYYSDLEISDSENEETITRDFIIVEVHKNSLMVIEKENPEEILNVSFSFEENNVFKKNQEIRVYWDGTILTMWPGIINNVEKVEILKDESNIEIPDSVLRYFYSSIDNINIEIEEFDLNKIVLSITDNNVYAYEYFNDYTIYKKEKNENYTGVGQFIGEKTETSTQAYIPPAPEYFWNEVEASEISKDDTIKSVKNSSSEMLDEKIEINWENLYGNLEEGEYYLSILNSSFCIRVNFAVNENNELTYSEPEIER